MKKLLVALMVVLSTGAIAQIKLGHVDSQKLLDTMPSRKVAIETLQKFEKDGVQELTEMREDFQKKVIVYQQKVQAGTMNPMMAKMEEEALQKKQYNIEERQQDLESQMQTLTQSLNDPILDRLERAVKIVGDRKKLGYVLEISNTLYYGGGTDITDEVAKELLILDNKETVK